MTFSFLNVLREGGPGKIPKKDHFFSASLIVFDTRGEGIVWFGWARVSKKKPSRKRKASLGKNC